MLYSSLFLSNIQCSLSIKTKTEKRHGFPFTFGSAIYFSALCCLLQGHRDLVNVKRCLLLVLGMSI